LNTTTRSFDPNNSWQNTQDIPGIKPSLTYTYELGYKGVVGKKWGISIDAYRTDFRNFIAPVTMLTPTVQFNSQQLLSVVGPQILANYNKPQNFLYKFLLDALLDNNASLGGNNNGTGSDELLALFQKAVDNLPIGVITPMETSGPDMLLVTRNIGDVTLYGIDVSSSFYIQKNLVMSANYSWMSKDSIPVESATMGYVAINAPKHKINVGLNYTIEKIGLTMGAHFQWNAGFPVSSGNYIGHQKATHDMDLDISYTPKFWNDHFNITVSIQNLYARKQQYFIGSPVFGTTGLVRMSYTL
jgi:iron complex outermembrane receptor protein